MGRSALSVPELPARADGAFAGINSMLPAALSLLLLLSSKTWTNGNDGLWRFMPSIAVDQRRKHGYWLCHVQHRPRSLLFVTPGVSSVTRRVTSRKGKRTVFAALGSQTGTVTLGRLYDDSTIDLPMA